ncbi:MAG: hypothetical protein ACD_58C00183G0003 [uncultured bacterium]|nr:MAG: hypothetical protein ACD_58C00183G0003 [uncultured bacterium]
MAIFVCVKSEGGCGYIGDSNELLITSDPIGHTLCPECHKKKPQLILDSSSDFDELTKDIPLSEEEKVKWSDTIWDFYDKEQQKYHNERLALDKEDEELAAKARAAEFEEMLDQPSEGDIEDSK